MHSLIRQIKKTYGMAKPHERKAVLHNFASLSVLQALIYLLPVTLVSENVDYQRASTEEG